MSLSTTNPVVPSAAGTDTPGSAMNSSLFRRTALVASHLKPTLFTSPVSSIQKATMSSAATSGTATPAPVENGQRKLKILMLHGYTQSGPSFHAKTKALEKALTKAFPAVPAKDPNPNRQHAPPPGTLTQYPGGIQLIYPTGPHRLRPSQIPGYRPSSPGAVNEDDEIEAYAWWRRNDATGEYFGLDAGLQVIADAITANGGIDAVIGFSQGGCFAAIVASLLDSCRPAAFKERQASGGIPYPESFAKLVENGQKPLKFCVSYAGFWAPPPQYGAFYEPKIQTPTLHVIGSLDTVVEEDRTQGLVDRTEKKEILVHPGGHFVPVGKEWVGALISYVRRMLEGEPAAEAKKVEESVEDMDMPF